MSKLKFNGHESFIARTFWPKKGYDFISGGGNFNAEDAVVDLGVGKNMVSSISFWMKALGLFDDESKELTELANFLFGPEGVDPYLEDIGTIWLLHYSLVKTNYSSIYHLIFNELKKERAVFTKEQLAGFIKRKYAECMDNSFNEGTVIKDINVFTRLYRKVDYQSVIKDFDDEVGSLMIELGLIKTSIEDNTASKGKKNKAEWYSLHGDERSNLPTEIVLFSILDNFEGATNIAMRRLEIEKNCPGLVFLLNKDAQYKKLKSIESLGLNITLSETAGNVVLVIPEGLDKWEILRQYYAN